MAATIRRLLVANRGEIARRIMRTAKGMGMTTIAVYARSERVSPSWPRPTSRYPWTASVRSTPISMCQGS